MPSKKLSFQDGSALEVILNLASLKVTHTTYINDINHPILPRSFIIKKYIIKAGATPKLITSVNESNSLPTLEAPPINLAILPSNPSITPATIMAITAISNLPSNENLIDVKPIQTPTNVKIFGNNTLGFLGGTILKFFFGSIYLFANNVSPASDLCSNLTSGL